jgi:lipopolysaccharide/colanic/teichoic acid biosynthesis glycosyltransferase
MISQATPSQNQAAARPTVWGLSPTQLHDRFWAARGVQVVRLGEPSEIVKDAELFLLTEARTFTIFKLSRVVDVLRWLKADVIGIRLHDERERGYRERAITGADDLFIRFERVYDGGDSRLARIALTPEHRIAQLWQKSQDERAGWRAIREEVPRSHRHVMSVDGNVYDRSLDTDVMQFVRSLVQCWKRPDSTVSRATSVTSGVWKDHAADVDKASRLIGSVWVGAGRRVPPGTSIVGPAVLWDDPAARPAVESLEWQEIEPTTLSFVERVQPKRLTSFSRGTKRVFDFVFALLAIIFTLPLYPIVMLAIWLEDGRPFFFSHKRETMGEREFGCVKFRSMRRDADKIKAQLVQQNQADGPQFFMEQDPRLTRVGRFIRKTYIDELPQFWNVLRGDMSVVGPRPSPFVENQYCPPWREARLSVRPGVTGLWQVRRTRLRGLDFQEWIKYDIEYVEKMNWPLDIRIMWETVRLIIRGVIRS